MIGIVEPNAHELPDVAYARTDTLIAIDTGKCGGIDAAHPVETCVGENVPGDVGNDPREVADVAIQIEHSGFFLSRTAVTQQLHGLALSV
jgi:hypothetical protein